MIEDKIFIIHIGMMKTASTYFQNYIFNQFEDIYYTGLWNIERNPINNFIGKILYTSIANIDFHCERKKIGEYIGSINQEKILISNEELIGNVALNFVNQVNIFKSLKKMFKNIKIIFITREQRSFLESYYIQTLHEYEVKSVREMLNFKSGKFHKYKNIVSFGRNIDIKSINYFNFYKKLVKYFEKQNVLLLPYEMFKCEKELFVKCICNFLETDFNRIEIPDVYANRSYSALSCKIARMLNRFMKHPRNTFGFIPERPLCDYFSKLYKKNNNIVLKLLKKISCGLVLSGILQNYLDKLYYSRPRYLTSVMRELIFDYHKYYNERLDKILKLDLSKYHYY